jgi:hypothetical protein
MAGADLYPYSSYSWKIQRNLSWKSGEIYYSDMGLVQIQPTFPMCLYVLCG